MATTDIIRHLSRTPLQRILTNRLEPRTIPNVNIEHGTKRPFPPDYGTHKNDVEIVHDTRCIGVSPGMSSVSKDPDAIENSMGREVLTAAMAFRREIRSSHRRSGGEGNFTGETRGAGARTWVSPTVSSSGYLEFPDDVPQICDRLTNSLVCTSSCTLDDPDEGTVMPPDNSNHMADLLKVLRKFDVTATPVPYKPKEKRLGSPDVFCKNLFLKDRRGAFFLVICDEDNAINLKTLRRLLKAYRNLSFATPEEMSAILKVTSGGLTPFGLMHGSARDVRVVMTTDLAWDARALLNFHPLDHTLTLPVNLNQLKQFLEHFRVELELVDMKQ